MKRRLTLGVVARKNTWAHRTRTLILLLLAAALTFCAFACLQITKVTSLGTRLAEERLGADILLYPSAAASKLNMHKLIMQGTPVSVYKQRAILSRMTDCEGIKTVSHQIYVLDQTDPEHPKQIVGFEPETDFALRPWIKEGNAFILREGTALIGAKVNAAEDGSVSLFDKPWLVGAHLLETGSWLDEAVFVSMETLKKVLVEAEKAGITSYESLEPKNDFSCALIRLENREKLDSITSWLNVYVRKAKAVRIDEQLTGTADGIRGHTRMLILIAALTWLLLLLAMMTAQGMMMRQRRAELYVWLSIGAHRNKIGGVMLREAMLVYALGALVGLMLSLAASVTLKNVLVGSIGLDNLTVGSSDMIIPALCALLLTLCGGCAGMMLAVKREMKHLGGQMLLS